MEIGQIGSANGQRAKREEILKDSPIAVMPFSLLARHRDTFHSHNYYQVVIAKESGFTLMLGARSIKLPKNSAIFIPSGVLHALTAETKCMVNCVYFRAAVAKPEIVPVMPNRLTTELILEISRENTSKHSRRILSSCLYDQLVQLIQPLDVNYLPLPKALQLICEVYQNRPETDESIADIVGNLGISERTIRRRAKKQLGCTLVNYRTKCRIYKATRLLQTGCLIKNVGGEIGFKSTSAFYAAFRATIGMSPADFQASLGPDPMVTKS